MNCQNELCIYNEENKCILEEISLDNMGMCESCIMSTIPQEVIKKYKEKTFLSVEYGILQK